MIYIGASIVCLLLLLFVRESMEKLYPIVQVAIFCILFAQIFVHAVKPLFERLATGFTIVPHSETLLYSALLLLVNQFVEALLVEHDLESIAQAVTVAIHVSLVSMWFIKLEPVVLQMIALLERVS